MPLSTWDKEIVIANVLLTEERKQKLKEAIGFTQGLVYCILNKLDFKNLRVVKEFPTKDNFPIIPYDQEAKRAKGKGY